MSNSLSVFVSWRANVEVTASISRCLLKTDTLFLNLLPWKQLKIVASGNFEGYLSLIKKAFKYALIQTSRHEQGQDSLTGKNQRRHLIIYFTKLTSCLSALTRVIKASNNLPAFNNLLDQHRTWMLENLLCCPSREILSLCAISAQESSLRCWENQFMDFPAS